VFALHGSSGDQNTFFDDDHYGPGAINAAAEKYGAMVLSPYAAKTGRIEARVEGRVLQRSM